jgi:hypothetical protein
MATNTQDIEFLLNELKSKKQNNIEKAKATHELFKKIKENLLLTIKSMENHPSMFSRAAEFWASIPKWQKILAGVLFAVPTVLLGIVAHLWLFLTVCIIATVLYAVSAIILDDHHNCNTNSGANLSKGILSLADYLEQTINALNSVCDTLTEEADEFHIENEKLKQSVININTQMDLLIKQIHAAAGLVGDLSIDSENRQQLTSSLLKAVEEKFSVLEELKKIRDEEQQLLADTGEALAQETDEYIKLRQTIAAQTAQMNDTLTNAHLYKSSQALEQEIRDKQEALEQIQNQYKEVFQATQSLLEKSDIFNKQSDEQGEHLQKLATAIEEKTLYLEELIAGINLAKGHSHTMEPPNSPNSAAVYPGLLSLPKVLGSTFNYASSQLAGLFFASSSTTATESTTRPSNPQEHKEHDVEQQIASV